MIVPVDHKHCRRCDTVKPLSSFRAKRQKMLSGAICDYHRATCKACDSEIDADRYQRRKQGLTGPSGRPAGSRNGVASLYVRPRLERDCDAAFMGWRAVEVVSFQGARL